MDLGVVVAIIVAAWIGPFVVVVAMCKVAAQADDQERSVHERAASRELRRRPRLHGLHLHHG